MVGVQIGGNTRALACGLASAFSVLCMASQASAGPSDNSIEISSGRLNVSLQGRLEARCQASGGGTLDLGPNLRGGLVVQAGFGLDCNVPFAIKVTSGSGGLAHTMSPDGQGPFAGLLSYTIDVRVPTETAAGPGPIVGGSFGSASRSKTFVSGLDGIASGGGVLSIVTNAPEGAGLLAGTYSDTVTITVSAL